MNGVLQNFGAKRPPLPLLNIRLYQGVVTFAKLSKVSKKTWHCGQRGGSLNTCGMFGIFSTLEKVGGG